MNIINDWPPNIDELREHFPITDSVIFTYSPNVYVPSGTPLTPALEEHEKVHLNQQKDNPDVWWRYYLMDVQFRYEQELEAHRVEWRVFKQYNRDRNQRADYLQQISRRLAGPLYNTGRSLADVRKEIQA